MLWKKTQPAQCSVAYNKGDGMRKERENDIPNRLDVGCIDEQNSSRTALACRSG